MESLSHIYPLSHNQNSEKGSWNGECDTSVAISAHPLEIKPAGNAYTASLNLKTTTGNFRYLPDELIIQILEELDSDSLLRLGSTCKTFYAFCRFDDLWKTLLVEYVSENVNDWDYGALCMIYLLYMVRDFRM